MYQLILYDDFIILFSKFILVIIIYTFIKKGVDFFQYLFNIFNQMKLNLIFLY